MKQSLCATAKREKSRRRGTLPCGKLPENKESAPEGAPKVPQNVKTPRRVCARRRKWSLNHFCRRPVRRQKSFSARKRASAASALQRAAFFLKRTPQRSGVRLKKKHPVHILWTGCGCYAVIGVSFRRGVLRRDRSSRRSRRSRGPSRRRAACPYARAGAICRSCGSARAG